MKRAVNPFSAFLSTTLDSLDKTLHGGVACGSLTEVKLFSTFHCVSTAKSQLGGAPFYQALYTYMIKDSL